MSEADTAAATQAPATEEQKHDVEYASEETKNAVSISHKDTTDIRQTTGDKTGWTIYIILLRVSSLILQWF